MWRSSDAGVMSPGQLEGERWRQLGMSEDRRQREDREEGGLGGEPAGGYLLQPKHFLDW